MNSKLLSINLKKIFIFIFIFFLSACVQQTETIKQENISVEIPDFIVLKNTAGYPLGKAFLAKEGVWITPDHLYEKSNELFCENEKISVLARDFDNDLLAFTLPSETGSILKLSNMPPAVDKRIYWFDDKLKKSKISAVNVEFEADSEKKKNLLSLRGDTIPGASGGVIFDEYGKVWGMIIGADKEKQEIFAVRSDIIAKFLKEIEI